MCTSPIQLLKKNVDGSSITTIVPCGKCAECRSKKQSEFAALSVLEADSKGSLSFITLTYNADCLPFQHSKPFVVEEDNKLSICGVSESFISRGVNSSYDFDNMVYPSLCRKDVQLLLKRYRQDYFRRNGERLDLRYSLFGEYGTKNNRPHYHMLVYGLPESEVIRLCRLWSFGFTYAKTVGNFNKDGSNAFVKCSRYVSKYIAKNEYLPDFVKDGLAEKPRRQSSIRLGQSSFNFSKAKDFTLPPTFKEPELLSKKYWRPSVDEVLVSWLAANPSQCLEV